MGLADEGKEGCGFAGGEDGVVEEAYDAEADDAGYGNPQTKALAACAAEGCYLRFFGRDIHRLDHKQVVVERHDCVDQRDKHEDVDCNRALVDGRGEDEEFAEESGKRGDTCEREHGEHHGACQPGVGLGKTVVVGDVYQTGFVFNSSDYAEGGEVGEDVDEDVVHHGR